MILMEILKSVLFGIVQGITEWLPISSTGHMILLDQFVKLDCTKDFMDMFLVVIQFGSILAVVTLFFHKLNPWSPKKSKQEKSDTWSLWGKVLAAVIPAAVIGFLFDDFIDTYMKSPYVIAATLIIYGIFFIIMESKNRTAKIGDFKQMDYKTAILIGAFQVLALIPGTSRSGATILGAVLLGTSRSIAAEFSFFLAIPVMFGASGLKMLKFAMKVKDGAVAVTGGEWLILLVGTVVAYLVSLWAIRFLMDFVKKHNFKPFGYYRIVLGIIVIAYFMMIGA